MPETTETRKMRYAMYEITETRTTIANKLQTLGSILAMNNLFLVRRLLSLPNGGEGTVVHEGQL